VLAAVVAEEEVDAFLFHQPGEEVEVGLAVLHAVVPGRVLAGELEFEVGVGVVGEHRFDDLADGLVLEDLAVAGAGEQPGPGRTTIRYWW
jgi:hypothetical protein